MELSQSVIQILKKRSARNHIYAQLDEVIIYSLQYSITGLFKPSKFIHPNSLYDLTQIWVS